MIDRKKAPQTHSIKEVPLIAPENFTLENGVQLYALRESNEQTARIDFQFDAGSNGEKRIIAEFVGELLLAGTEEKDSDQIDEEIDSLGGYTDIKVSTERATVTVFGLLENILPITEIIVDAIQKASFPEKELQQAIQEMKKRVEIRLQKVKTIAQRTFVKHLLNGTPYGELIELEDFRELEVERLNRFHKEHYLTSLQNITIVGALTEEQLKKVKTIGNTFGHKKAIDRNYKIKNDAKTIHIEKEKALQTAIRIGKVLFNKTHPDFQKFSLMNTVLGGYFGSRLMTSIREEKGYTYGIGSGIVQLLSSGYFYIASEVAKEFKDATIEAIREEIELLQREEIDAEELMLVKNYMIGQILELSDGAQNMMDRFQSVNYFGLTLDYYDELIQTTHQITAADIQAYAKKYLQWEDMTIVTVG